MSGRREQEPQNDTFRKVVGYFLDHEKPKDGPVKKPVTKPRKKPSTKAKKRA